MTATIDAVASTRAVARAAEDLDIDREHYARLITGEMGKTITASRAEIAKCIALCRYYLEHAGEFLAPEAAGTPASRSFIRYEPLGPVLGVMPWNFPFWQVFRFAVPALLAGNSVIVKHSSRVPRCAAALQYLFGTAIDIGVRSHDEVDALIDSARVRALVFTGGEEAGRALALRAAAAGKKTILELGGSDPLIVMPSADIDAAVRAAVRSRIHCNGQACTAAKRFVVARSIAEEFEQRFAAAMSRLRTGDPFDEETDVGPLASEAVLAKLEQQVSGTVRRGARVLTGGSRIDDRTFAPTVLTNVPLDSPVAREETFGPVAPVFRADDIDDAIRIANATRYGLGASVWTRDAREADQFVQRIESGLVFVNAAVSSHPALPFGGSKASGYGRELGAHGIRELCNAKSVWVA